MEVAGLVLGGIPLIIESFRLYQATNRFYHNAVRSRHKIDEICRIVGLHQVAFECVWKEVLIGSGCDISTYLSSSGAGLSHSKSEEEDVKRFLRNAYQPVIDELQRCNNIINDILRSIVECIPKQKSTKLIALIEANQKLPKGAFRLTYRTRFAIRAKELEIKCNGLGNAYVLLQTVVKSLSTQEEMSPEPVVAKNRGLGDRLLKIRQHTPNLHHAICSAWTAHCHQHHEVKLEIELQPMRRQLKASGRDDTTPVHEFRVMFTDGSPGSHRQWHQIVVQVSRTHVFRVGAGNTSLPNQQIITDICSAVHRAVCVPEQPIFVLTPRSQIEISSAYPEPFSPLPAQRQLTLADVLRSSRSQGDCLTFAQTLAISAKAAAGFVQVVNTAWAKKALTAEDIKLLEDVGSAIDLSKAFVSIRSGYDPNYTPFTPQRSKTGVYEALAELGILLLELWHEELLQNHSQLPVTSSHVLRLTKADEWRAEMVKAGRAPTELTSAIFNCLSGIRGTTSGALSWNDTKLWKLVCEKVVVPIWTIDKACTQGSI